MKKTKEIEKLNDLWLRIIGIPVIAVLSSILFFTEERIKYNIPLGRSIFFSIIIAGIGWEINRRILLAFRRRYPGINLTSKRVLYSFLGFTFSNFIVFGMFHGIYAITLIWNHPPEVHEYFINVAIATGFTSIIAGIYEMIYYFEMWKVTIKESEELKKENLQSQLDSLRNQINPHFLFNSLNTLEALTEEDNKNSTQFVRELANVYRFILQSQDKKLNSVREELDFIKAYSYLLKTRFGNNFTLEITVSDVWFDHHIPPLTLQMLVENAMKHNIVSSAKPLWVKIMSEESAFLAIINNLQPKNQVIPSNKVGLSNIKKRYEILGSDAVSIDKSDTEYIVKIPLLKETV